MSGPNFDFDAKKNKNKQNKKSSLFQSQSCRAVSVTDGGPQLSPTKTK